MKPNSLPQPAAIMYFTCSRDQPQNEHFFIPLHDDLADEA
jgi:hypothetical protein